MTTLVTISNDSKPEDYSHDIEITYLDQKFTIKPGDSFTTHIWGANALIVNEAIAVGALAPKDASHLERE